MYSYRGYNSSSVKTQRVSENGTMGRHTSASPPPVFGDGKRRPIRARLQNITTAMTWIKEELEGIKEQDKSLLTIFEKVQGDVRELSSYVSGHRSSTSSQGTLSTSKLQPQATDTNLELDFDILDDSSENGDLKDGSPSLTPSPPPIGDVRGLSESGASYSNLDLESNSDTRGSRDDLGHTSNHVLERNGTGKENGSIGTGSDDKEDSFESPSGVSLSLGSLDLDFSTSSFGLGTISEGRSLMNIPMTTSTSGSSHSSGSGGASPSVNKSQGVGMQRSVSQQLSQKTLASSGTSMTKERKLSYQPPSKQLPPQTLPKPRRGSVGPYIQAPPPQQKLSTTGQQRPVISVSRQISEVTLTLSPKLARKDLMRSSPHLDRKDPPAPSPPRTRRDTDSLPRHSSRIMTPLLPFQAQQELRDAAKQVRQDHSRKVSNGIIPQLQTSPILHRRQPPSAQSAKQPSPPLPYRSTSSKQSPQHRHSPVPTQRASPTPSRLHSHLAPEMKPSSSMNRLSPSVSRAHDETASNISRNSSIDSGIQFASEGENGGGGGGVTSEGRKTSVSMASSGKEKKEDPEVKKSSEGIDGGSLGFGDLANDIFSTIASMGGGDSLFS